jgi:hypothetical protein
MRARATWVVVALLAAAGAQARQAPSADLAGALKAALAAALPFPHAEADGMAADGRADAVWTVRWPAPGEVRVEVLANPLNARNRERALKAEQEIQQAAMQSQRRSQQDYEKAVSDFQRTGRTSEIREISLRDDGLAGERYDAESQLTIVAELFDDRHARTIATSKLPEVLPAAGGASAVIRLASNTYQEGASGDDPGGLRFCPEQAWVFVGGIEPPDVTRRDEASVGLSVTPAATAPIPRGLVIWMSGNVELVDRVLQQADWSRLRALVGG